MPHPTTSARSRDHVCLLLCLCAVGVRAQTGNLLVNGDFAAGFAEWEFSETGGLGVKPVACALPGLPRALALTIAPTPGAPQHALFARQVLEARLPAGHRLRLRAWLRSAQSQRLAIMVEGAQDPWPKYAQATLKLTPEWTRYEATGALAQAVAPGAAQLVCHLNFDAGTIEMTGVEVVDMDADGTQVGPRPTVAQPLSLLRNGDFAAGAEGWSGANERLKVTPVDATVDTWRRALRLEADPPAGGQPWSLALRQRLTGPVRRGDAVYFRAWLRSPDRVPVSFILEQSAPPHAKEIDRTVALGPEWREYRFVGRARAAANAGELQALWFLGRAKGTVEVAGVRVENYGAAAGHRFDQTIDYWAGRAHPDTWRAAALARIEQIRKGDLTVAVAGADGRPVPGAQVAVRQLRHGFRFGSAVPARRLVDQADPNSRRMQQETARLYNVVTFENDLKWHDANPQLDATIDQAIAWCREREIDVRAHNLIWGSRQHLPPSVRDLGRDGLLAALRQRAVIAAARYRGRTYLWDVVNEAATNTEVWDTVGWERFAESFRWAREGDPEARLCYNDFGILTDNSGHRAKVATKVRYLLDQQAPVDVLGMQGHMGTPLVPIHRVLELMDEWAAFGKDLEITEFDLGGAEDDQVHGDYVRDFMIAAFSHPKLRAFIMWGFWEGAHWRARETAQMFNRDWTARPAQTAWEDLVLRQWWTRLDGQTGADGRLATRAFHGRHEITVTAGGQTVKQRVEVVPGKPTTVKIVL